MDRKFPEDIVSFLGGNINNCERLHYKVGMGQDISKLRKFTKGVFLNRVKPYYSSMEININNAMYNFLLEPLKNAVFHGGGDVSVDLLFNQKAFVSSFRDGGDYFKGDCMKDIWEHRIPIHERNIVEEDQIGFGSGSDFVYSYADLIHVDANNGILYLGLNVDLKYRD